MSTQAGSAGSIGLGKRSRSGTGIAAAIEASKGSGSLSIGGLPILPSLGPYIQVQGNFPGKADRGTETVCSYSQWLLMKGLTADQFLR